MDPRLDWLFSSLEAQFGAQIERAEEAAADDLALSLRQDRSLRDVIGESPHVALTRGGERAVCEVAKDHVRLAPGTEIVPLTRTVFEKGEGTAPRRSDLTLVEVLREEVRRGRQVTIEKDGRELTGRPLACGEEHIVLAVRGRDCIVPLARVRSIRLSHED